MIEIEPRGGVLIRLAVTSRPDVPCRRRRRRREAAARRTRVRGCNGWRGCMCMCVRDKGQYKVVGSAGASGHAEPAAAGCRIEPERIASGGGAPQSIRLYGEQWVYIYIWYCNKILLLLLLSLYYTYRACTEIYEREKYNNPSVCECAEYNIYIYVYCSVWRGDDGADSPRDTQDNIIQYII